MKNEDDPASPPSTPPPALRPTIIEPIIEMISPPRIAANIFENIISY